METLSSEPASGPPESKNYFRKYIQLKKRALIMAGVLLLVIASFLAGAGSSGSVDLSKVGINVLNQNPEDPNLTTVDYGLLWKVLKVVNSEFVDQPVDQKKLMYGAVQGLVRALDDPHSSFLPPDEYKSFREELSGEFDGIGAEVGIKEGSLIIVAPLPNTPAERAGLRPQDLILKIDGEESLDWDLEKAVSRIRGPKGTTVRLTVIHKGEEKSVEVAIVRESIKIESATTEIKESGGKKVGVIKLVRFGPDTKQAFSGAADKMLAEKVDAIILDMRNNPGGLLDAAIDVSGFWLTSSEVALKELSADKKESLYYANGDGRLRKIKTIVLINEGSASASEIVTGALQDYKLARVAGMKSFGKGSVQDLIELEDGAAVKISIAKWLTPNGRSINKQGLEPDVKVEMSRDDYLNKRDPQLERALQLAVE